MAGASLQCEAAGRTGYMNISAISMICTAQMRALRDHEESGITQMPERVDVCVWGGSHQRTHIR